jgi:hypothetical protein
MEGAEMIDYLHSIGAKVHYWVVNDARYMQRLLAKGALSPRLTLLGGHPSQLFSPARSGIDGLITDRPDVAYAVWQQMGYDMPASATLDAGQVDGQGTTPRFVTSFQAPCSGPGLITRYSLCVR